MRRKLRARIRTYDKIYSIPVLEDTKNRINFIGRMGKGRIQKFGRKVTKNINLLKAFLKFELKCTKSTKEHYIWYYTDRAKI